MNIYDEISVTLEYLLTFFHKIHTGRVIKILLGKLGTCKIYCHCNLSLRYLKQSLTLDPTVTRLDLDSPSLENSDPSLLSVFA